MSSEIDTEHLEDAVHAPSQRASDTHSLQMHINGVVSVVGATSKQARFLCPSLARPSWQHHNDLSASANDGASPPSSRKLSLPFSST